MATADRVEAALATFAQGFNCSQATLSALAPEVGLDPETHHQVAAEFIRRFVARHGALTCRELLGCDPSTPEGQATMKAKDFHNTVCPRFVKAAVEIAGEVLEAGMAEQRPCASSAGLGAESG